MYTIRYSIEDQDGELIYEGDSPSPPKYGDELVISGKLYCIINCRWRAAGDVYGEGASGYGYSENDLAVIEFTAKRIGD